MREIITVTGSITGTDLGFCQFHEHIAISKGVSYELNPDLCIDDTDKSIAEAIRYKNAGGHTIIDAQPCGCNRMTRELVEISKRSEVSIIASTGFHKLCFYPKDHWIHSMSISDLETLFIHELSTGMYVDGDLHVPTMDCSSKAGIIKTAFDSVELTPRYKELFTAAARASLKTSRTIMIHVEKGSDPRKLQSFLLSLDVPAKHMVFCHLDRACDDITIHTDLLSKGSFLEFDTIGRFKYHTDEDEIKIINTLVQKGYSDQILYSLDTTRARLKSYTPQAIGLDYILNTFNQKLQDSGLSEECIHQFSVDNPLRALTY